ncbi:MAG: hypothetical protein QNK37_22895 [Acidobacteriota bacterium]|nr:hypothetical protein [Acidobacteriota bacterium]
MTGEWVIRVDEETDQRLLGETASLSQHQLVAEAVRNFSWEKERYIKAVQQGQEDFRNGRVVSHKDLIEELASRLADLG